MREQSAVLLEPPVAPAPRGHALGNALVLSSALLLAVAAVHRYTHLLPGSPASFVHERERCYGVARAGGNDCGTAKHACAGRASGDGSPEEWLSLPAGTCRRIAGGALEGPVR